MIVLAPCLGARSRTASILAVFVLTLGRTANCFIIGARIATNSVTVAPLSLRVTIVLMLLQLCPSVGPS